jgi:hypothetical protein
VWGHYLELGGTADRAALAEYLHGASAWPALDHNVLAQALNEHLWDLGIPSLAPLRALGGVPCCEDR